MLYTPPSYEKHCLECGEYTVYALMYLGQLDECENCGNDLTKYKGRGIPRGKYYWESIRNDY